VLDLADQLLSPLLLGTLVAALFVFTKLQSGLAGAASKLSARPLTPFADVIGSDEAKAGLNRVKAFMHDPTHCARLGASAPRGALMVGPPGTGKTLLAKALAGESKANFIAVDGIGKRSHGGQGGGLSAVKGLLSESTRERLAYPEAGHALVGHWLQLGAVERVTIEPRGQALGVTCISRGAEDPLYAQGELSNRLAMMLGGREAELLVKGSVSSGASDDLKRASELAISMVGSLGFSKTFGVLSVAGVPKELLGPGIQAAVLKEARVILEQAQARCEQLLRSRRTQLDALAQALLQREVLCGDELKGLLACVDAA
jgi:ATP-dependent Zn protease